MIRYLLIRFTWIIFLFWLILTILYFSLSFGMWRFWYSTQPFSDLMAMTWANYTQYLGGIVRSWDWGVTRFTRESVWSVMLDRAVISLRINLATLVVYVSFSIVLGLLAAVYKNRMTDRIIMVLTLLFSSVPNFLWVWFLIFFFGFRWGILPPQPHGVEGTFWGDIYILIIPVTALALYPIGKLTAMFRGEFIAAQRRGYSVLLRVKGLSTTQMARRHWFKDALVPILSEIPNTFIFVLSSSFIVERFYSIHGVTWLLFQALFDPFSSAYGLGIDLPLAMAASAFYIFLSLSLVLVIDIVNVWLDPRIRLYQKDNVIS